MAQVGEGAFATVLRGNVTLPDGTKRVAAIKRLKPSMLSDRDFKDFVLEAAVLSKLDHPCIVKMFGVGTTCTATLSSDSFYYVSEFCDGGNLKDLLYKQVTDCRVEMITAPEVACTTDGGVIQTHVHTTRCASLGFANCSWAAVPARQPPNGVQ